MSSYNSPDLDFDLSKTGVPPASRKSSSPLGAYLRGPIPWTWLWQAIPMGGSALATALALWHLRALNKSVTFKASLVQLRKWTGLTEKATRAGLRKLELAGLVTVDRPDGQSPTITINPFSTADPQTPVAAQNHHNS